MVAGPLFNMKLKAILGSSLFKNSGIYTLSSLLNAAIPFALLPYLTRVLTVEDYGILTIFMLVQSFLGPFVSVNANAALSRKYFSLSSTEFRAFLANVFFVQLISTFVTLMLVVIFINFLMDVTQINQKFLIFAVFAASGQFVVTSIQTIYQVQNKPVTYGILQVLLTLINLGLTFFLVSRLQYSAEGRILAITLAYILSAVLYIIWIIRKGLIQISIKKRYLKYLLSFGLPLIPHVIGGIVLGLADRLMINKLDSSYEAGIFGVAVQLCSAVTIILSAFNAAFIPWLFSRLKLSDKSVNLKIVKLTYLGFLVIALGTFIYSLMLPWMIDFIAGEKYVESQKYINWILIGLCFNGFYILVSNYIFYAEKTHLLAISTFCCAIIYFPLVTYLFNQGGSVAIPQASAISFGLLFISTWIMSSRVHKMPWLLGSR